MNWLIPLVAACVGFALLGPIGAVLAILVWVVIKKST